MPKPLNADLVRETFKGFRGEWDWAKRGPVLRIPLRRWSAFERGPDHDWSKPTRMEYAEYRYEVGWVGGENLWRIVGSIPGTDVSGIEVAIGRL